MKEWSNPFNPFNSWKVLWHKDRIQARIKRKLLPPVQVDITPTNICDYGCVWCNSKEFNSRCKDSLNRDQLMDIVRTLRTWNGIHYGNEVKSVCVAGGGEPLQNRFTYDLLEELKKYGFQVGLITNGHKAKNYKLIADTTKWVGVSVDAGTQEAYSKLKGVPEHYWFDVWNNIGELVKAGAKVTTKYLIHPYNQHTIYDFILKSREIGVKQVQLRPVGWYNLYPGWQNTKLDFDHDLINAQLEDAFKLENDNFKIYGVRHKFNTDFGFKNDFSKCYCNILLACFAADGYVYGCFDRRGMERICKHGEIIEYWGSEAHLKYLDSINPKTCPRCTFGFHNKFVEKYLENDPMCVEFP